MSSSTSINGVEIEPDPSRAFFQRSPGQIGIYIDVMEASESSSGQVVTHGSEHYYIMLLTEILVQELNSLDIMDVKGGFELSNVLRGAVIEEFRPGIVMVVRMTNTRSLLELKEMFENGNLTKVAQKVLVQPAILTSQRASMINIRAKIWDDEWKCCMAEITEGTGTISNQQLERNQKTMSQLNELQKTLSGELLVLKDKMEEIESNLGEFIHVIKRYIDMYKVQGATSTLTAFRKFVKMMNKRKPKEAPVLVKYLATLEKVKDVWLRVVQPMWFMEQQIHPSMETTKQAAVKEEAVKHCHTLIHLFDEKDTLNTLVYPEWEAKMTAKERTLVLGLVSLIPLSVNEIVTFDLLLDEYHSLRNTEL